MYARISHFSSRITLLLDTSYSVHTNKLKIFSTTVHILNTASVTCTLVILLRINIDKYARVEKFNKFRSSIFLSILCISSPASKCQPALIFHQRALNWRRDRRKFGYFRVGRRFSGVDFQKNRFNCNIGVEGRWEEKKTTRKRKKIFGIYFSSSWNFLRLIHHFHRSRDRLIDLKDLDITSNKNVVK